MLNRALRSAATSNQRRSPYTTRTVELDRRWPDFQVVIGLECHAQLKSSRKLFSDAPVGNINDKPNSHVAPFDAAFPGALPVLNQKCVDLAIRTALALKSHVQRKSIFDRKHYFYTDLPSGYQITQQYYPFAKGGLIELPQHNVNVRIKQIQLEQDTAKSTSSARRGVTEVDLNRAGKALLEIVSEPDMATPQEVGAYIRSLQTLLRAMGTCDGNMEDGSLRCDVNVSVNRPGEPPGTRCEVKNLNSAKSAMVAIGVVNQATLRHGSLTIYIAAEVLRQTQIIRNGGHVIQETRGFDEDSATTFTLRRKEDAPDYRYMPDPNIPPLLISEVRIQQVRETMPELPQDTRHRLLAKNLSSDDVEVLMTIDSGRDIQHDGKIRPGAIAFFDTVSFGRDAQMVLNWISNDMLRLLTAYEIHFSNNPVSTVQLGDLLDQVTNESITGTSARVILEHIIKHRSIDLPSKIALDLGLQALTIDDTAMISGLCDDALKKYPQEVKLIQQGKMQIVNKLVGNVMKSSKGRANAQTVRELLLDKIGTTDTNL